MIAEELQRMACALQFMTRLPLLGTREWPPDRLARSARYFSLAGLVVGTLGAGVLVAARLVWPNGALPTLLAITTGVLITGGLHEDGLADTADGLGGGHDPEQRLAIMKDSRLGGYGALALGLVLAVKAAALTALPVGPAAGALICAHGLARAAATLMMAATPYAADPAASKLRRVSRDVQLWEAAVAFVIGALPLIFLPPPLAVAGALAGALAAAWPALAARRLVGGHTGDILGAVEQAFETGFLVGAAAAWALAVRSP